MPYEQFLQRFEISRAFLCAKQVRQKPGKFQNVVQIAHTAVTYSYFPFPLIGKI